MPGPSVIRKASPADSGSARLDRASAPFATKTCWSGSSGSVTVPPAGEPRDVERRGGGAEPGRRPPEVTGRDRHQLTLGQADRRGGVRRRRARLVGRSQTWMNRAGPDGWCAISACDHAGAGGQHLHRARDDGTLVAVVVGVHERPGQHPRDDLQVAVRMVREPAARAQHMVVVADHRPESDVLGVVVGAERERVAGARSLFTGQETGTSPTDLDSHGENDRVSPPIPPGVPLRNQHCVVPDRGRVRRGRQGPQHLGHLHRATGEDQGRVDRSGGLRPLPPVAGGRGAAEAAGCGRVPAVHRLAADPAQRVRHRPTRRAWRSTTG